MSRFLGVVTAGCCVVIALAAIFLSLHAAGVTDTAANARLFEDFVRLRVETSHGLTQKSLHELALQAQVDALTAGLRHQISGRNLEVVNADLDRIFAADDVWRQIMSNQPGCTVQVISGLSYVTDSQLCLPLLKPFFDRMHAALPAAEEYLSINKIIQPALGAVGKATDDVLSRI